MSDDTPEAPAAEEGSADEAASGSVAVASQADEGQAADEHAVDVGPDVAHDVPIAISGEIGTGEHKPIKDRLLLPLLVPVLSAIAVGMLAVNISRVFLAGSEDAALISAIVITLAILIGASLLAAAPHMKSSSLAVILGLCVVIVVFGGLLTLGPSIDTGESEASGYVAPTGPATSTVTVQAGAGLTFDSVPFKSNFAATAGVVQIDYTGEPSHTLAFREPELAGFELHSPPGKPQSGKVELKEGVYDIYCTIPGHAAAGMEGTVTVGPAA